MADHAHLPLEERPDPDGTGSERVEHEVLRAVELERAERFRGPDKAYETPTDLQEALATIPRPPPLVAAEALKKPSPPFGPAPKGWRDWDFRDRRHPDGEMRWPLGVNSGPSKPYGLWPKEQRARYPGQELADVWQVSDYVREASRRFDALSDEDRAVFEARSELLRQEAWDEWEKDERDRELARERGERPRRRRYSNIKPRSSSDEISQLIRQVVAKPK